MNFLLSIRNDDVDIFGRVVPMTMLDDNHHLNISQIGGRWHNVEAAARDRHRHWMTKSNSRKSLQRVKFIHFRDKSIWWWSGKVGRKKFKESKKFQMTLCRSCVRRSSFFRFGRILDNTEIACQTLNISSLVGRKKLRQSLDRSKRHLTRKFDRRIGGFMWSKLSVLNTVKNLFTHTRHYRDRIIARCIGAHTLTNRARSFFREIQLLKFKACPMTSLQPSCTVCATCFWPTLHWLFTICPLYETERERLTFLRLRDLHFTLAQRLGDH